MSGCVYGGDEVGAVVFDSGHTSMRVGFAGEDCPKGDIPAYVGTSIADAVTDDTDSKATTNNKFHVDTTSLCFAKAGMKIHSYMKDCMIEDWDLFEKVIDYSIAKVLHSEADQRPVLFSEAPWNVKAKREKLCELMFEKYNVPAFFLCKNAVLTAFANGRWTGIVVDSGATHTSAVPLVDGYVLQQAVVRSPTGGDYISKQCRSMLDEKLSDVGGIVPMYKVKGKEEVKPGDAPKWMCKDSLPDVTSSWHDFMVNQLVDDFKKSALQVSEQPYDEEQARNAPSFAYEFPNGCIREFGSERFRIPEVLFDPSVVKGAQASGMLRVAHEVTTAIGMCDVDLRPSLYSSVIVTGGNSLLAGFTERLNRDLAVKTPANMRFKLIATSAGNGQLERRFGAWIGGSMLGSLGSFQQMWISKMEYEESGKAIVDRKCP